jgi:hypothetical protein
MENGGHEGNRLATHKKITGITESELETFMRKKGMVRWGPIPWVTLGDAKGMSCKIGQGEWERLLVIKYDNGSNLFQGP